MPGGAKPGGKPAGGAGKPGGKGGIPRPPIIGGGKPGGTGGIPVYSQQSAAHLLYARSSYLVAFRLPYPALVGSLVACRLVEGTERCQEHQSSDREHLAWPVLPQHNCL